MLSIFWFYIFIIFEDEDCTSYFIDKCKYDPDDLKSTIYNFKTREICQAFCKIDPDCNFFIYDRSNDRCDFLKWTFEGYMKTCKLYGGPTTGSVAICLSGIENLDNPPTKCGKNCKVS